MTNIYRSKDLAELFDKITTNSIGLDRTIQNFWESTNSYPPFNIIQENNHESTLEIALAGFKKKEVKVYTEHGKLIVEGKKEEKKENEYVHRGMKSQRSFQREWQLTDDVEIKEVVFEDGLLSIHLGKVVPEHHARKDYL